MALIRLFFLFISVLFMTGAATADEFTFARAAAGGALGLLFGAFLLTLDYSFRKFSLKEFTVTAIGLLIGYLFSTALIATMDQIINITGWTAGIPFVKTGLTLFSLFFGVILTWRAAEEFTLSLPFIRFNEQQQQAPSSTGNHIVLDESALHDVRMIDLANSGLLDKSLILPKFLSKDLEHRSESTDEPTRNRARRCLENIRKLEQLPNLHLKTDENDFPEIKDGQEKTVKLAKFLEANLLTAEMNRIDSSSIEGITVINIRRLAEALKPITETGEFIDIKIQRYGKEPRQGVGYLDDGTMVVVNGGGDYIGETIKAQVLSVKHTSSGRMVFCNAADEDGNYPGASAPSTHHQYQHHASTRIYHQQ